MTTKTTSYSTVDILITGKVAGVVVDQTNAQRKTKRNNKKVTKNIKGRGGRGLAKKSKY